MYRQVTILKSNPSPGADYGEASELNLTLQGLQFSSSFLPETSAETSYFNTFSYGVLDAFIEFFKLWSMILLCKSCIVLFFFWIILVYRFLGMVLTTLCSIRVRLCCASDCLVPSEENLIYFPLLILLCLAHLKPKFLQD